MSSSRFNALTLEMPWTRLISIVDEAAAALLRADCDGKAPGSSD